MSSRSLVPIVAVVVASVVAVGGTLGVLVALQPANAAAVEASASATADVAAETGTPAASAEPKPTRTPEPTPEPSGVAIDVAGLLPDGPLDPAAVRDGLATSPYTFSATVTGFPSYAAMGSTWTGRVTDPTHFSLDFPAGASLTRYRRAGVVRTAYLGELPVSVSPGDGSMRTPDDLLPLDVYAAAIEPWTSALPDHPRGDAYIADTEQLTATARGRGLDAQRWALTVAVDVNRRLTSVVFTGWIRSRGFRMELQVTYDDAAGGVYGRGASPGPTDAPVPAVEATPAPSEPSATEAAAPAEPSAAPSEPPATTCAGTPSLTWGAGPSTAPAP